jgi:dethiobiotin synthetase
MTAAFSCFVTGTDTGIGKTLIATTLLYALEQRGVRTAGMKPVAAGAVLRDGIWHNDDADALAQASNVVLPSTLTTPYLLHEATAPSIAAAQAGIVIDIVHVRDCYNTVTSLADAVVVEGIGGFRVPLSTHHDTADLARQLALPVVLVVGLRLGCLNHALLSADAIAVSGLMLAGWIGNVVDLDFPYVFDHIDTLAARLPAPLLGCVPRLDAPLAAAAAVHLDFSCLPGWPGAHHY